MNILEFLKDPILKLPKNRDDRSYESFFLDIMNEYTRKLGELENFEVFGEHKRKIDTKSITDKAIKLTRGLIGIMREYKNGSPFKAYKELKATLNESDLLFKVTSHIGEMDYFRVRESSEKYSLSKEQLFHIPFELTSLVNTQRYSIPGFPSLYLADNIYTCWEEMKRPVIESIHASRFHSEEIIHLFHIPNPSDEIEKYLQGDKIIESIIGDGIDSLLTNWPLYFACSIKVKEPNHPFKPEYIIPQLMLQYVRENPGIHGISYFSTNIDRAQKNNSGSFNNYVFPVRKIDVQGHCQELKKLFKLTEPVSYEMIKNSRGGETFFNTEAELTSNIESVEIIKGQSLPYTYSQFHEIERTLNSLKASKLD